MRLDKFLKVSRVIKRRTLSKEISDRGRVMINGRTAKPASEVKVNDILEIHLGDRRLTIRVELIKETVSKQEAELMYVVIKEEFFKEA